MKRTLELWSQFVFRIAAVAVVGLLVVLTIREQNRPEDVDLQDTRLLEKMESYIKTENVQQWKPQMADDQPGPAGSSHSIRSQKSSGGSIRS
jgi:hypothetical protein